MFYRADKKGVRLEDLSPEAWTILGGGNQSQAIDKLYATVSWLYRCVELRANGVMTMPFAVKRGRDIVAEYDGVTFDDELADSGLVFLPKLPRLLAMVEAAATLSGAAYFERRTNVLGSRVLGFDWLLPSSVTPEFDRATGELTGFKRGIQGKLIPMTADEIVYFWRPDHTVERGPAKRTPGKAVLQNAGVIGSMDIFLEGYFARGMVKATLLQYKDRLSPDEGQLVKEWWRRVFAGVRNAHATEVVRGDFSTLTIGEGIKDLRDNALTDKERESIASGLGVPQSKVTANAANFATKQSDDVMFIEDTILPEIGWIYEVVNEQILPDGYRIVALPERLRIMQQDEHERADAFAKYRAGGVSLEATIALLGIDIPDGIEVREPVASTPPQLAQAEDEEKDTRPPSSDNSRAIDILELLDKRDEAERFKRWLKNRDSFDVSEFVSDLLTEHEKVHIAIKHIRTTANYGEYKALQDEINQYKERFAGLVSRLMESGLSIEDVTEHLREEIRQNITAQFRRGAGLEDGDVLNPDQAAKLNELLGTQYQFLPRFVADAFAESQKGRVLDKLKDTAAGIGARVELWGNALREALNLGRIFHRNKEAEFEWRLGATEEHCADCLAQHGKVRKASEWQQLAGVLIYPQSRALSCKGYNCDCALYQVN